MSSEEVPLMPVEHGDTRFQTMADESPVILWITDAQGDNRFVNRTYREFFGVSVEEVEGSRWQPLVHPDDAPRYLEACLEAARAQKPFSGEARVRRVDGEWRWIAALGQPRFDATGRFLGHVCVCMDITERKSAEEQVRRQASLLDQVGDAVISTDEAFRIRSWNKAAHDTYGFTENEALGRDVDELLRTEFPGPGRAEALRRLGERGALRLEVVHHHKSGGRIHAQANVVALRDAEGRVSGMLGVLRDVSEAKRSEAERRRAEDALRESESLYRSLFTLAPSGVVVTDEDGRIHEFNDQAHANMGYSRAEFGELRISDLDAEESPAEVSRHVQQIIQTGSADFYARHRTKSGELRDVRVRSRLVHLRGGARLLSVLQDVTDRKRAEEALRDADKRKTEFLGVLSHELRNPLAPIRNSIYLLERAAPLSETWTRARQVIDRQTEHLTRLVDDLLDVTRISRGKVALHRTRFDLREIVRKAGDDIHGLFQQAGIALHVDPGPSPVWVDADPTRISQVLGNLLQNSVKFTLAGGEVVLSLAEVGAGVEISVRDTGIGMEPAGIDHLFEPFAQADKTLARTKGGLGLGLALVKGLVELHGGSIQAHSDGIGLGSEFVIRLPGAHRDDEEPLPAQAAHARPQSILVIEDNPDAGQSLAEILAMHGHRVRVARDGQSGIALARAARPDVILCDIGLPDLDGFEIARAIRGDAALRSTRLVALSGYAQPEDRQRAQESGFDAHVAKPPDLDELISVLAAS